MKNVTLDRTPFLQLDAVGTDSALDAAADCHVLRNDAALDLRAIANQEIRSAQFTFDSAKDLRGTLAFDVADNRHVRADAGGRSRFCRRPVMRLLSMASSALLSFSGALLFIFNMSTSPFADIRVRCTIGHRSNATMSGATRSSKTADIGSLFT